MRTLYLGGGGSECYQIDKEFAKNLNKNKTLLYLPHALPRESFALSLSWLWSIYNPLGITNITCMEDLRRPIDYEDISAIYIGGGKTAHLLKQIRSASFDEYLINAWELGIPIYGGSAGAIILGQDIRTSPGLAQEEPSTDLKGLNILNGFCVSCHFTEQDLTRIAQASEIINSPVLGIPEQTGIIVRNDELVAIGSSLPWIVRKNEVFRFSTYNKRQ